MLLLLVSAQTWGHTLCNHLGPWEKDLIETLAHGEDDPSVAVWQFDTAGRLLSWNEASLLLPLPADTVDLIMNDRSVWYYHRKGQTAHAVLIGRQLSLDHERYELSDRLATSYGARSRTFSIALSKEKICDRIVFEPTTNNPLKASRQGVLAHIGILLVLIAAIVLLAGHLLRRKTWTTSLIALCIGLLSLWGISSRWIGSTSSLFLADSAQRIPLSYLIASLCCLGLCIHLLRYHRIYKRVAMPLVLPQWVLLLIGYSVILLGLDGVIYAVHSMSRVAPDLWSGYAIQGLTWPVGIFLSAAVCLSATAFLLGHIISDRLISSSPSNPQRLILMAGAVIGHAALIHLLLPALPLIGYVTLVSTSLILMDLFVESKYRSVSWVVIWLVFIAMGLAALLHAQAGLVHTDTVSKASIDPVLRFIVLFTYSFSFITGLFALLMLVNRFYPFIPETWHGSWPRRHSIRWRMQYAMLALMAISFLVIYILTSAYIRADQQDRRLTEDDRAWETLELWQDRFQSASTGERMSLIELATIAPELSIYTSSGSPLGVSDVSPRRVPYDLLQDISMRRREVSFHDQNTYFQRIETDEGDLIMAHTLVNKGRPLSILDKLLGSLLHIYLFLFVLTSSIALAFADSITRPIFKLSKRFGQVHLRRRNERIEWSGDDELGQLVQAYNGMIAKIEESVDALAMTERESAWREMAKQVAHEIKNPLTPMKLSIQHLQMTAQRQPEEVDALIARSSKTLLEQIDNLSLIASEFSNFAQMPQPDSQQIVVNEVVATVHDLFRKRDDIDIQLYVPVDEIYVFADKHYLSRVVINLVTNAIQAIPTHREGHVHIRLYKKDTNAIIEVRDNGSGVPVDIRDKIFQPNFTSKSTGTGLGLPICAKIIELFNGKIYYETELNAGTSFFVALPMLRLEDNFPHVSHVRL